jgi:tetratricopeptide (TPR) repeat protein
MGKLDKAEYFSHKAKKICAALKNDHELYRICWSGIGYLHFCRGDQNKANRIGKDFITYSKQNSDIRCLTLGHLLVGLSNFIKGDLNLAISNYKNAIDVSVDPMFTLNVRLALGLAYVSNGQIVEAENALKEIIQLSKKNKYSYFTQTTSAKGLMGIISLAKGDLNKGKKIVEEILRIYRNKSSYYFISHFEYLLGKVYMQMLLREEPIKFSFILKNIGFLIRNVPFAKNRSERHFKNAIKLSREINAKFVLGQAYLDLGRLYKGTKRLSKAKEAISESISIFKQCEADRNMENANIILETLE